MFKVMPDLATFCKGIGNGMPLGVICGREDIMQEFEEIFVSGTMCGETLSMAAADATIKEILNKRAIEHNWRVGDIMIKNLKDIQIEIAGYPCRPAITSPWLLEPKNKTLLIQELIKRGILMHSNLLINICYSHTDDDIQEFLAAMRAIISGIRENRFELEGQIIQPAFRRL